MNYLKTTGFVGASCLMALLGIGAMFFVATQLALHAATNLQEWNDKKVHECQLTGGSPYFFPDNDGNYLRCNLQEAIKTHKVLGGLTLHEHSA